MWIKLRDLYQSSSMNCRLFVKSKFYSIKMTEKASIKEHICSINSLITQLANIGIDIPDEELVDRVLTNLPSNWKIFKQMISNQENPLSFEALENLLLHEDDINAKNRETSELEEALYTSKLPQSRNNYHP